MHTSAPNRLVQPLSQVIVAAFPSLIFVLLLPNRGKLFSFFSFGGGGGGGGYIVGYTDRKLFLWQSISGAVKRDFRTYIRRYTSPNASCEGHPHFNAIKTLYLKQAVKK